MSPEEKAQELIGKYYVICQEYTEEIQCYIQAKQCALVAVREVLGNDLHSSLVNTLSAYRWWKQVEQELEKS